MNIAFEPAAIGSTATIEPTPGKKVELSPLLDTQDVSLVLGPLLLMLISGLFILFLVLSVWVQNHQQPASAVPAIIVTKRSPYFVTFELESGDRLEMCVPRRTYGILAIGDRDILTHQGDRYVNFERLHQPG